MIKIDMSPIHSFSYIQIPNHNFNFLLLDENFRALHTPFECKDYLQDIFWAEYTGNKAGVYGIIWEKGRLNTDRETFFLALMGPDWDLAERIPAISEFLYAYEDALEIPHTIFHETEDRHTIVLEFSKKWTENGPLLSAFTTLIRLSGDYSVGENMIEYLQKLQGCFDEYHSRGSSKKLNKLVSYMKVDVMRMKIKRFLALLSGKKPEHNWNQFKNVLSVHDTGMVNFKDFPEVEM